MTEVPNVTVVNPRHNGIEWAVQGIDVYVRPVGGSTWRWECNLPHVAAYAEIFPPEIVELARDS